MGEDALILTALALALSAVGPVEIDRPLTVGEVWARHRELNGATIQVVGILKGCGRTECIIAEGTGPNAKWLGVDLSSEKKFDSDNLTRHRIVAEGRFNDSCIPPEADPPAQRHNMMLCIDQAITLFGARIVETP